MAIARSMALTHLSYLYVYMYFQTLQTL